MEVHETQETSEFNLNIKLQLFYEKDPFIFIQNDLKSKRYRISTNFEYLNKNYNLKLQYIRNFDHLHPINQTYKNSLFEIIKHRDTTSLCFKNEASEKFEELVFKIEEDGNINILKVYKYIMGSKKFNNRSSIIIFNKIVNNESNYSLFFASEVYFNIEEVLKQYNHKKDNYGTE